MRASSSRGTHHPPVGWRSQTRRLLWKHALVHTRRWRPSLVQALTPLIVCAILHGVQRMADAVLARDEPRPPSTPVGSLPRCQSDGCVTLVYGPSGVPWVEALMREVARRNGLSYEDDFQRLPPQPDLVMASGRGRAAEGSSSDGSSGVPAAAAGAAARAADAFAVCRCDDPFCATYKEGGSLTAAYCVLAQDPLCRPCAYVKDARRVERMVLDRPGRIQNALLFTTAYLPIAPFVTSDAGDGADGSSAAFHPNTTVGYVLMFNGTVAQYPYYGDNHAAALKLAVDEAVLALSTNRSHASISASSRRFPIPPNRFSGVDVAGGQAGIFFYVPPMVAFFHTLMELVDEKERGVRLGMHTMGLRVGAFWTAEGVKAIVISGFCAALQVTAGAAFGFDVFDSATPLVTVPLFFLFTLSMCAVAACVSAFVSSTHAAQSVGYSVIIVGFVFQALLSGLYGLLVDVLTNPDNTVAVRVVVLVLKLWPPLQLAKGYYQISYFASKRINFTEGVIKSNGGFGLEHVWRWTVRNSVVQGVVVEPLAHTLGWLVVLCVLYGVLAVYLDAVIAGNQSGAGRHPLFFLPHKLLTRDRRRDLHDGRGVGEGGRERGRSEGGGGSGASVGPGVEEETARASAFDQTYAVRIVGLRKMYAGSKGRGGVIASLVQALRMTLERRQGEDTERGRTRSPTETGAGADSPHHLPAAVDDLHLTANEGEVLCLLGPNGSGKTTTLGMLSGLIPPTRGTAYVQGHDITASRDAVRGLTGLCPQHDTLWDELSAEEHLVLFAGFRGGISGAAVSGGVGRNGDLRAEVAARLGDVGLAAEAGTLAARMSGGMRRRLSLAIAVIGDPKVIYLDEPGAGLDPISRHKLWSVVQRLKAGRTVILTTHDMEEADALADRVAIMALGQLQAVGTPLALKTAVGAGYRLKAVLPPSSGDGRECEKGSESRPVMPWEGARQKLLHAVRAYGAPDARIEQSNAGSVVIVIPRGSRAAMPAILAHVETMHASGLEIREWGVSHATLEDVFVEVARRAGVSSTPSSSSAGSSGGLGSGRSMAKDEDMGRFAVGAESYADEVEVGDEARLLSGRRIAGSSGVDSVVQGGDGLGDVTMDILEEEDEDKEDEELVEVDLESNLGGAPRKTPAGRGGSGGDVEMTPFRSRVDSRAEGESQTEPWSTPRWAKTPGGVDPYQHGDGEGGDCRSMQGEKKFGMPRPIRAVLYKNISLMVRQPWTFVVQVAALVSAVLVLAVLQETVRWALGPAGIKSDVVRTVPWPLNGNTVIGQLEAYRIMDCNEFFYFSLDSLNEPHSSIRSNVPIADKSVSMSSGGGSRRVGDLLNPNFIGHLGPFPQLEDEASRRRGFLGRIPQMACTMDTDDWATAVSRDLSYLGRALDGFSNLTGVRQIIDLDSLGSQPSASNASSSSIKGQVPYFLQRRTEEDMLADVYSTLRWLNSLPVSQIEQGAANRLPDGVVTFHDVRFGGSRGGQVEASPPSLSYTFSVNDNLIAVYHRANNFSRVDVPGFAAGGASPTTHSRAISAADQSAAHGGFDLSGKLLIIDEARLSLMDMMHAAFLAEVTGRSEDHVPELLRGVVPGYMWRALTMRYAQRMPFRAEYDVSASVELFGAAIYPLALTIPLPVLLYLITLEKEERLRELQRSMGLKTVHHIAASGMFALAQYLVSSCVFGATGAVVGIRVFLDTGLSTLLALTIGWGLCLVSIAFAVSTLLSSRQLASVTGCAIALFGSIACFSVATVVYGDIPTVSERRNMPRWLFLIPQLALSRVIYLLNYECVMLRACAPGLNDHGLDPEVRVGICFLYLDAVLVMCLALYLDLVLPGRFGVPASPLFFLRRMPGLSWAAQPGCWAGIARRTGLWCDARGRGEARSRRYATLSSADEGEEREEAEGGGDVDAVVDPKAGRVDTFADEAADEDVDVSAEAIAASTADVNTVPLVLRSLRKVYPERTTPALAGVSIAAGFDAGALGGLSGGCFGLLGPNGAGKSTLFNCISGVYRPSSGNAWVSGHSVVDDIAGVHRSIGVCHQQNILWDALSPVDHLAFYARLKGVRELTIPHHVRRLLAAVGLSAVSHRPSSALSGGMRRRLCLAIALCGEAPVVFLDEPSAGLDPLTRRGVWRILTRARRQRLLLLTTHAMDEAEHLSTRIGVLSRGRLRAVGTPQRLRAKHGGGYTLTVGLGHVLVHPGVGSGDDAPRASSVEEVDAAVMAALPTAVPSSHGERGGERTHRVARYRLPDAGTSAVPVSEIFKRMEALSPVVGEDWGITQVGLDEVFRLLTYED